MRRRYLWVGAAVLALALVLAFPLRDVIQRTVIVPLAYFFWSLGLFYKAMPQLVWWTLAVLVVLILVVGSLSPGVEFASRIPPKSKLPQGQVEGLAEWMRKARRGVYFKWLVANRLGKLAYAMLVQRDGNPSRSVFAPLVGADWRPPAQLQKYLETGLHGSFADYPESGPISAASASPLDLEIGEVVEFLESQRES